MPVHVQSEGTGPQVPAHLTRIPISLITASTDVTDKIIKGKVILKGPLVSLAADNFILKTVIQEEGSMLSISSQNLSINVILFGPLAKSFNHSVHQGNVVVASGFTVGKSPTVHKDNLHPCNLLLSEDGACIYICLEFKRIVGKDLLQEFYSALDDHNTLLTEIFRAKRCNVGEHLAQLLQQMHSLDPTEKRTVILRGPPYLLGGNPTEFFKSSFGGDESFGQMDVRTLMVNPEGVSPPMLDFHPVSLKIVIEGEVVVEKLMNLPEAIGLLFGLTYGLHVN